MLKNSGELPIVGVNTFSDPYVSTEEAGKSLELARSTVEEKDDQLDRLGRFVKKNKSKAPKALEQLQKVTLAGGNIFSELMNTVRVCSLGQITKALYEMGGQYRRNM